MPESTLVKVKVRRIIGIIGPTPSAAAVLLGNEKKTFVVFVGYFEAAALIREINGETPARPMTHELVQNVFVGFDVEVKKVIISTIIDNTFCATLVLEQRIRDESGEWVGRRNEVRIDARPSDCLVLALKNNLDVFVTEEVFDQVPDVSKMISDIESGEGLTIAELETEVGKAFDPGCPLGEEGFETGDDEDSETGEDADSET